VTVKSTENRYTATRYTKRFAIMIAIVAGLDVGFAKAVVEVFG